MSWFRRQNWVVVPLLAGLFLSQGWTTAVSLAEADCQATSPCCQTGDEACCRPERLGLSCEPWRPEAITHGQLSDAHSVPGACPCEARSHTAFSDEPTTWLKSLRQVRAHALIGLDPGQDSSGLQPALVRGLAGLRHASSEAPLYLRNARLRC